MAATHRDRTRALAFLAFALELVEPSRSQESLGDTLGRGLFYNTGTVHSTDRFQYVGMAVSYNEPDNVSCTECGWADHSPWFYEWQTIAKGPPTPPPSPSPSPSACTAVNKTMNQDYPGCDLGPHPAPTFEACLELCCANDQCYAILFENHSDTGEGGYCTKDKGCCWLKNCIGTPRSKPPATQAVTAILQGRKPNPGPGPTPNQPTLDEVKAPPTGYRSSPALGGVSAGSTELRADGSFREWTIFNQGPAGSGKYGLVDDVYMGLKVGKSKGKMVRTNPPNFAGGYDSADAVDSITFSGTYPLTRLVVNDSTMAETQQTVYGYSTLKPGSLNQSAYPAVVLTLNIENPTSASVDASFMFSMPFGAWTDCSRAGGKVVSAQTYQDCMHACTEATNCSSWQFDTSSSGGVCTHNTNVPLTGHRVGSYCGIRSDKGWEITNNGKAITRSQRPLQSGPSMGDITLQVVGDEKAEVSFATNDDPQVLWNAFSENGSFGSASLGNDAHAIAAIKTTVAAKASATLSIIFSWHFPDRDFNYEILGNMYAEIWTNSSAVAQELGNEKRLSQVVADINTHHQVVAHPQNPTPVWLKDQLINQFSHFHMLMWYKDGRLREYEAWSCDDVDSVHNDYQRHLLYLWFFPEFEYNKMDAWSTFAQAADGHIWESLGYTGKNMDDGGGRLMGDTTTLYLLELYELFLETGNKSYVLSKWSSVDRALAWMVGNAGNFSLPQKLQTTYDHFGFNNRQTVVYNCHIYLTALKAVEMLANAVQPPNSNTSTIALQAYNAGKAKLELPVSKGGPLWNDTHTFFLAHSETTTQVFTDSLYGQMLSHHFFNGSFTCNETLLSQHLAYEWEQNQDLYGMRVLSSPIQEDSIWMNGPPTWSYLSLAMGEIPVEDAYEPFKRMSENFRTRLHDMWNLRALTHSQTEGTELEHGQPREQGHYGFMLTDLYLLPLLSGQNVNMHTGVLSVAPKFKPPYVLPVLLMNCQASIEVHANTDTCFDVTLTVAFGSLSLPANGLSWHGCVYADAVELTANTFVTWSC